MSSRRPAWGRRQCCLEAYALVAFYFGPGELVSFNCPIHGDVQVRTEERARDAFDTNEERGVAHLRGDVPASPPVPPGSN